jgi:hypothetical protein
VIDDGARPTVTVATGAGETVIEELPVNPSLVAVIVVVPAATALTNPLALTVAAVPLLELHVTIRPVRIAPFASLVTAVSCCAGVMPRTSVAERGVTVTVATGAGVTVIGAPPVMPSLVPTMLADPADIAVTSPVVDDTVATPVLSELQVIVRPVSTRPFASNKLALACVV